MSEHEVIICDECDKQLWDEYADGWQKNIDGEDFCPECLQRRPLDPPERDDD